MRYRKVRVEHFGTDVREDPAIARLCGLVEVRADDALDKLYPEWRPSRVTVETLDGRRFTREGMESLGSKQFPIDDGRLGEKFIDLAGPTLGAEAAAALLGRLWRIEEISDVTSLIDAAGG